MSTRDFPEITYDEWRQKVEQQLGEPSFEEAMEGLLDGIRVEALYTRQHPAGESLGAVGSGRSAVPQTVGTGWTICQRFASGDPQTLNHHLKSELSCGVDGVRLQLQRSDDSGSKTGVRILSVADWQGALADLPDLWRVLLLDAGADFLGAAAQLHGALGDTGLEDSGRLLLLGADPLGELARTGSLPEAPERLLADLAQLVRWAHDASPATRAIGVDAALYREAGAGIDQEVALALATGVQYLRDLEDHGAPPEVVARQIVFLTGSGQAIFPEMAKLRALRVLWNRVVRACGIAQPREPWIHASVLHRTLAGVEPSVNHLRATAAALAALAGGADSLETPEFDRFGAGGPSARGRRLARNLQSLLGHESHLGKVRDPGAGSYAVEALSREVAESSWESFREIERRGGLLACLGSGWLQEWVGERWQQRSGEIAAGKIALVGVNVYRRSEAAADMDREPVDGESAGGPTPTAAGSEAVGETSEPMTPATEERWSWCRDAASRGLDLATTRRVLYPTPRERPRIEPLTPRRDEEAVVVDPESSP